MNKHRFSFSLTTILLFWGGLAALTLSSCENFLKGADVKKDLDKAIAYANAKSCTVYVKSDTDMGSFLSSGEKECRVGFSFELVFTVNKEYYSFKSLKAVSINDQTKSRSDYVQFTLNEAESDPSKGIYRVNATLLKEANDILIVPDCISYLRVVSYSPSFTDLNAVGVPIEVEFSIPVDSETIEDNIIIMINNEDKTEALFESPILDEDNTSLTIFPKAKLLKNYIRNTSSSFVEARVLLSNKITAHTAAGNFSLLQNSNSAFSVRYDASSEENPPEEQDFFITRHPVTIETADTIEAEEKFTYGNLATPPDDFNSSDSDQFKDYTNKVRQNRTQGTVYIYGEYKDLESGVKTVVVEEKLTNNFFSIPVNSKKRTVRYTADSPEAVFKTEGGVTEFCIEHKLETDDGAVRLNVSVKDAAGNSAEDKNTTAFKKSFSVISSNHYFGTETGTYSNNPIENALYWNDFNAYHEALKSITDSIALEDTIFEPDICLLYWFDTSVQNNYSGDSVSVYLEPAQVKCEYKNNKGKKESLNFDLQDNTFYDDSNFLYKYYSATLVNIDSLSGLALEFTFSDDLGNSAKKTIRMPSPYDIALEITNKTTNSAQVSFSGIYGDYIDDVRQIKYSEDGLRPISIETVSDPVTISSSYKYKVIAQIGYYGFWTELPDFFYDINSPSSIINEVPDLISESITIKKSTNTYNYGGEDYNCLDIIVPIKKEAVLKYDTIQIDCSFDGRSHYSESVLFPKDILTAVISLPTFWFYDEENSFHGGNTNILTIYGINNSGKTKGKIVQLPHYIAGEGEGLDYDNEEPQVYLDYSSLEELHLIAEDPEYSSSGIKTFEYRIDGAKKVNVEPDAQGKINVTIPLSDLLENDKYEYRFSYTASDNATESNINRGNLYFYYYDFPEGDFTKVEGSGTGRYIATDTFASPLDFEKDDVKLYSLGTNGWQTVETGFTLTSVDDEELSQYYNKISFSTLPGKYIKVITSKEDKYSSPAYFYFGSTTGTGKKDMLLPTGFMDSVAIQSDAPVFVHTLVTKKPYNECKNWTIKQWEYYKKHLGEKELSFSSSNTAITTYNIPVNQIYKGESYVVIAHYATGRVAKSEVMVKD